MRQQICCVLCAVSLTSSDGCDASRQASCSLSVCHCPAAATRHTHAESLSPTQQDKRQQHPATHKHRNTGSTRELSPAPGGCVAGKGGAPQTACLCLCQRPGGMLVGMPGPLAEPVLGLSIFQAVNGKQLGFREKTDSFATGTPHLYFKPAGCLLPPLKS